MSEDKPLYEVTADPVVIKGNAPIMPPSGLFELFAAAQKWAVQLNKPMYVYLIYSGIYRGFWTCGAFPPADDPHFQIEPNWTITIGEG